MSEYFKERYNIKCPYCRYDMQCAPSIFHTMGLYDCGSGTCPTCEKHFEIIFIPDKNEMKTESIVK